MPKSSQSTGEKPAPDSQSKEDEKTYAYKMVRTDHTERKLDSFLSPSVSKDDQMEVAETSALSKLVLPLPSLPPTFSRFYKFFEKLVSYLLFSLLTSSCEFCGLYAAIYVCAISKSVFMAQFLSISCSGPTEIQFLL